MGSDLLRYIGLIHLLTKFHKAFADASLELTGTIATESVNLAHECNSGCMPRLMADLTKDGKRTKCTNDNEDRVRGMIKKHFRAMDSTSATIAKIPNLMQVCQSIDEIIRSMDEFNGSEKPRTLGPTQGYGYGNGNGSKPTTAAPAARNNIPDQTDQIVRSPFINRNAARGL
jgi:hypothetical protein